MSWIKLQSEYSDLDKYKNSGNIFYFKKDTKILHNPYGPSALYSYGSKAYYINDEYHRLDGPAIMRTDGIEFYFINNIELTKEEFEMHPERLKYLGKEHLICLL